MRLAATEGDEEAGEEVLGEEAEGEVEEEAVEVGGEGVADREGEGPEASRKV